MHISFIILVVVLHVYMASAEPLPTRSAHSMTVVQRRRGYKDQITSEEYQSEEINHSQEEEEEEWNETNEQKYSEHESKDSSDIKSLEAKHSNDTNTDNKNDEHVSNHHNHHHHHSHEIDHLAATDEKPYNYTKEMEAALNLADHREIAEVLNEITGFKAETMVIAYCKTTACLKTDQEAYEFLKSCGGARGIKFVIRLLKKIAGTANIKVIAELLKIITDEDCVTPGLNIILRLTGHHSIDGVLEVLQIISGRSSLADVIDFYEHNGNHKTALDGISHEIYKLTGDVGPKEFPGVFEALKSEVDWTATFNILITVMRCDDIGEAIVDLKKLLGAKTFPEAIDIMKLVTEQTHFRYALEAFLEETGRVNLKIVIENLYKLTGKSDLMSVHQEFQRLYKINNIIKVFQTVNKISKKRDPLVVLSNLMDLTGAPNLCDCSSVFTGLTFKQMTALEVIGQIQIETGCTDLVEFLRGMLTVTGTRSLLKSWQIIVSVTGKNDIYELISSLKIYTSVDLITVFQLLQRITNTINIVPAVEKINEIFETKGFFEWLQVLHHIVEIDVVVFLESFARLSPRSLLEDAIDITMHYTDIYVPIQAIADLKEATQQEDIVKSIEYVKSKKSKHTTTTTTTLTPSDSQEPISDTTLESTSEPTTVQPETTSENLETQSEPATETAIEHTSEQPQEITTEAITEAITETTIESLPEATAETNTEQVSEAATESTPVSTSPESTENPITEQIPVTTPEATTDENISETIIVKKDDENQQSPANSNDLSNSQNNIPIDQKPHPVTNVDTMAENPNPEQQHLNKIEADDKQTPEKPIIDASKDKDDQNVSENQKDVVSETIVAEPVSTAQSDVVQPDENAPNNKEIPANQETAPVDNNQTDTKAEPTSSDQKIGNQPSDSIDKKHENDQSSLENKQVSINQTQPVSNDQKDLNEPNHSNQQDIKDNAEKDTIVNSDTQNATDTTESLNNKSEDAIEKDSQPAASTDQVNTVKQITIIEDTNTVPGEISNQEKVVDNPSELSPIDSSKNQNISNDKLKDENLQSDAPNADSSSDKNSTIIESPIPTSIPTEVLPEKPVEEPIPSDQPKEKLQADNHSNTEVTPPLNNSPVDQSPPISEVTPPLNDSPVDQSPPISEVTPPLNDSRVDQSPPISEVTPPLNVSSVDQSPPISEVTPPLNDSPVDQSPPISEVTPPLNVSSVDQSPPISEVTPPLNDSPVDQSPPISEVTKPLNDSPVDQSPPISEVTPPLNVSLVDQSPTNDIPTTEKLSEKPEQGSPDTDNKQETPSEASNIKTTDKESPASDITPENSSQTNNKPDDNTKSPQPSEQKLDENDNKILNDPSVSTITTTNTTTTTTQSEQGPLSAPDIKNGKPDPQALQVNMNLKLLILPKGPKGTKNCYCACDSQDPPKLIPMKHLPVGITNAN